MNFITELAIAIEAARDNLQATTAVFLFSLFITCLGVGFLAKGIHHDKLKDVGIFFVCMALAIVGVLWLLGGV